METKERIRQLAFQAALSPQEETLLLPTSEESLRIGIPKEIVLQERRVALDPDAVGVLVAHGHEVVVETGAGVHAQFSDADYSEAGARIAPDAASVYANDIILKVAPPQEAELEHMRDRQTIFSGLQLATHPERTIEKMMERKMTAVAWDFMQDRTGIYPLVRAMGEIAGTTSILVAGEYLSHPEYGDGSMMGGMTGVAPSEVVIIGAGTVGEFAAGRRLDWVRPCACSIRAPTGCGACAARSEGAFGPARCTPRFSGSPWPVPMWRLAQCGPFRVEPR